jgi:hypothetical protein
MIEDVFVAGVAQIFDPPKQSRAGLRSATPVPGSVTVGCFVVTRRDVLLSQAVNVGPRRVNASEFRSKDGEESDEDCSDKQIGNEGRHKTRCRIGTCVAVAASLAIGLRSMISAGPAILHACHDSPWGAIARNSCWRSGGLVCGSTTEKRLLRALESMEARGGRKLCRCSLEVVP